MYLLIHSKASIKIAESIEFTFHNVSINSRSHEGIRTEIAFTFHNVSINSAQFVVASSVCLYHLHSIMYLLIPRFIARQS